MMRIIIAVSFLLPVMAFGQWDVTLDSAYTYNSDVSYTSQDVLVSSSGSAVYNGTLTLNNCLLQVDGSLDCRGDIVLNNSAIEVKGVFNVSAGVEITETGASFIRATGDNSLEGKVNFQGNIYNKIEVYSDLVTGDSEFLIIDPNSSANSTIENTVFHGGFCNIWIMDKRLNTPINNCFFFGSKYGVWQDGIYDLTDIRFCLFVDNFDTAITVVITPYSLFEASVLVDNVVIDNPNISNSFGCVVAGVSYPDDYGIFRFTNSIITNTYCGWYVLPNTYVALELKNMAYYGNTYDDNLYDSSSVQENPMYLTQSPFETPADPNSGQWPYFLNEQSPVAEIEPDYNLLQVCPQQLQTSLFSSPVPRTNGIGIGVPLPFDYATKLYDLEQDFNSDNIVNNLDFVTFADNWLSTGSNPADFNDSNSVDTADLIQFCGVWLSDGSIRLDVVEDDEKLTVTHYDPNGLEDCQSAFFLNGRYIGMRDADNPVLTINKSNYPNGQYCLKAIVIDGGSENHYAAYPYITNFNCPLSNLRTDKIFDPAKGLGFSGEVRAGYVVDFEVRANDEVLWSGTFDDDFNVLVDPNTLGTNVNYEVSYVCEPDVLISILNIIPEVMRDSLIASTQSSGSVSALALDGKPDYGTAGLVICMLADGMDDGTTVDDTGTARYAEKMMRQKGVNPIVLSGFGNCADVTYDTIMKVFNKYKKIHYMHIYAHGNYQIWGPWFLGHVQRTGVRFNDGDWPAFNSRYWTDNGFAVPNDYEWLRAKHESGPSLAHFPFAAGQLKILVMESCHGLRNVATRRPDYLIEYIDGAYEDELRWNLFYHPDYPFTDVCFAFKMTETNQMALGSADLIIKGAYTAYKKFFNTFWDELGNNNDSTDAIAEAVSKVISTEIPKKFRARGRGYNHEIYLRTN